MVKKVKKSVSIWWLIVALVVVVFGSVLFVGAVAGWFNNKTVSLSEEYYNSDNAEFLNLDKSEYEKLVADKKSFVVFIDQEGCKTADNLQGFLQNYIKDNKIMFYKMMFSEMKKTSLHERVRYYPSVVIISRGEILTYLRADADEDADIYNDEEAFKEWMNERIEKK